MTIAQRFSAGRSRRAVFESVSGRLNKPGTYNIWLSRCTDYVLVCIRNPPMNRWAIIIRGCADFCSKAKALSSDQPAAEQQSALSPRRVCEPWVNETKIQ